MGPLHAPGGDTTPVPPATEAGDYMRPIIMETALGAPPEDSVVLLANVDRDGAADAVMVRPWLAAGNLGVEAAHAMHGFDTCWRAGPAPEPPPPGAEILLADRTGDGKPDLWQVGMGGRFLVIAVATYASGYREALAPVETIVPATPGMVVLAADHDRDGSTDLVVVRPGDPGFVEVWPGPSFDSSRTDVLAVPTDDGWRFALGDRHGDGVPDLFALAPDGRLLVLSGADGWAPEEHTAEIPPGLLQAVDLDGDGRADLAVVDDAGRVHVLLGGDRPGLSDADLLAWFLTGDDHEWHHRDGCPADPARPPLR
jgi:hypothetical protein